MSRKVKTLVLKQIESKGHKRELAYLFVRVALAAYFMSKTILLCAGCSAMTDFDRFHTESAIVDDSGPVGSDGGMGGMVEESHDAGDLPVSGDSGADSGSMLAPDAGTPKLDGRWLISRTSNPDPIQCSQLVTSQGAYTDEWVISERFGLVTVQTAKTKWPIEQYSGEWDGQTMEVTGEGAGPVDGFRKTVESEFTLTLEQGRLIGSEVSQVNDCNQVRMVTGVRL